MRIVVCLIAIVVLPGVAHAQQPRPLPVAVLDLRAFYSGLGQDPTTAAGLDVVPGALPNRGLGGVGGLHFYPVRRQKLSLGIGGEGVMMRGRAEQKTDEGTVIGEPINQRLMGLSGMVSLNFGHRDGWSYVSAGMGPLSFGSYVGDTAPAVRPPAQMTINLGAGARWFITRHVAFSFDLRFYQTQPEVETELYPPRQRKQLFVLSGGIAVR